MAITALQLDVINKAHWTASAFFISSLVFGILAVFSSFKTHQELACLVTEQDVLDWLSRMVTHDELLRRVGEMTQVSALQKCWLISGAPTQRSDESEQLSAEDRLALLEDLQSIRETSAWAAISLAIPSGLISLSLNAFLIGLGTYLGSAYSDHLFPAFGKGGSLGLFLFYLLSAVLGILIFSSPRLFIYLGEGEHELKPVGEHIDAIAERLRIVRDSRPQEYPSHA